MAVELQTFNSGGLSTTIGAAGRGAGKPLLSTALPPTSTPAGVAQPCRSVLPLARCSARGLAGDADCGRSKKAVRLTDDRTALDCLLQGGLHCPPESFQFGFRQLGLPLCPDDACHQLPRSHRLLQEAAEQFDRFSFLEPRLLLQRRLLWFWLLGIGAHFCWFPHHRNVVGGCCRHLLRHLPAVTAHCSATRSPASRRLLQYHRAMRAGTLWNLCSLAPRECCADHSETFRQASTQEFQICSPVLQLADFFRDFVHGIFSLR